MDYQCHDREGEALIEIREGIHLLKKAYINNV